MTIIERRRKAREKNDAAVRRNLPALLKKGTDKE